MSPRLLSFAALLAVGTLHAQTTLDAFGDPLLFSKNALDMPSMQGLGFKRVSVTLPTFLARAENNILTARTLQDILVLSSLQQADIDKVVDGLDNELFLGFDVKLQGLGVGFNLLRDDGTPWLSIGVEHQERALFSMRLDREAIDLIYYGNKQFAGQELVLDPLFARSLLYRSIGGNVALDLRVGGSKDLVIRPGIGMYALTGMQGTDLQQTQLRMFTHSDGRAIDITSNYDMNIAVPADGANWLRGIGTGMAVDASVGVTIKERLQLYAGVNDIGGITFKDGVKNYRHQGSTTYDGVNVQYVDAYSTPNFQWDTLLTIVDPTETAERFTMKLPTNFLFYGQLGLGGAQNDARTLFRHVLAVSVREALTPGYFTRSPFSYMLGYTYVLGDRADFGITVADIRKGMPGIGLHSSTRMGPLRVGVGSSNTFGLFAPNSSMGADLRFQLMLTF